MKLIKAAAGLSIFLSYVLLSNWETGNIGNWAIGSIFLICVFWTSLLFTPEIKEARRCGNTKRAKRKNLRFYYTATSENCQGVKESV